MIILGYDCFLWGTTENELPCKIFAKLSRHSFAEDEDTIWQAEWKESDTNVHHSSKMMQCCLRFRPGDTGMWHPTLVTCLFGASDKKTVVSFPLSFFISLFLSICLCICWQHWDSLWSWWRAKKRTGVALATLAGLVFLTCWKMPSVSRFATIFSRSREVFLIFAAHKVWIMSEADFSGRVMYSDTMSGLHRLDSMLSPWIHCSIWKHSIKIREMIRSFWRDLH